MSPARNRNAPSIQLGFSMLEVMVAVLVVSLGLLGLSGLQTVGLRNNASASQRTIATQLAYDMADRMRANWASVLSGSYNYAAYSTTNVQGQTTASCLTTTGCTSTQLALEDIYQWNQQICSQLPQTSACTAAGPWGVICKDDRNASAMKSDTPTAPGCPTSPSTGAPYVIKIWWVEDRNDPSAPLKLWFTTFLP